MKKKERQEFLDQLIELRAEEHIKTAEPIAFLQEILGEQTGVFKEDVDNGYFKKIEEVKQTKDIQKVSEKTMWRKTSEQGINKKFV